MADKPQKTVFESNGREYVSICPGCRHMPKERSAPLPDLSLRALGDNEEPLRYPYFYCEEMHTTLGTLADDAEHEKGKVLEIPDVAWCEGHEHA